MSNKERLIGEFEMNFKKSIFQWRSTLIKDDIISAYVNTRPGLKTGRDLVFEFPNNYLQRKQKINI